MEKLSTAKLGADARTHEERLKVIASKLPNAKIARDIRESIMALQAIRFELENRVNHLEVEIERLGQK